jgi:hypothetical protein
MNLVARPFGEIEVNLLINLPDEIRRHAMDRYVFQESAATANDEHRADFNEQVLIETAAEAVFEEANPELAGPHVCSDISVEVVVELTIRGKVHIQPMISKRDTRGRK